MAVAPVFAVLCLVLLGYFALGSSVPTVKVGGSAITLNFVSDEMVPFDLDTRGVPDDQLRFVELVFASTSTCFFDLYVQGRLAPFAYMEITNGLTVFSNWVSVRLEPNATNAFSVNSTLGSCVNTAISAAVPPTYQLPFKSGASLSNLRVLPSTSFNVTVGSAGQMLSPFALNITTNSSYNFMVGGIRVFIIGPGLPPAYLDSNQVTYTPYGGNGSPVPGPITIRIFVGENYTVGNTWAYLNVSIAEEKTVALKVGGAPVKVVMQNGLSNIFSVPMSSKANTVVQLKLVGGSCPYLSYNANSQEIVGTAALTPFTPQAQITLLPGVGSATWPLVIVGFNNEDNCVYQISV
jgi:hypothetical protein